MIKTYFISAQNQQEVAIGCIEDEICAIALHLTQIKQETLANQTNY